MFAEDCVARCVVTLSSVRRVRVRPKYRAKVSLLLVITISLLYSLGAAAPRTTTSARAGFPDRYRSGRFLRPAVGSVAYTRAPPPPHRPTSFPTGRKTPIVSPRNRLPTGYHPRSIRMTGVELYALTAQPNGASTDCSLRRPLPKFPFHVSFSRPESRKPT